MSRLVLRSHLNIIDNLTSAEGRGACMYDKNGIVCCTKKLDMFHSWQENGWLQDQGPFDRVVHKTGLMKYLFDKAWFEIPCLAAELWSSWPRPGIHGPKPFS